MQVISPIGHRMDPTTPAAQPGCRVEALGHLFSRVWGTQAGAHPRRLGEGDSAMNNNRFTVGEPQSALARIDAICDRFEEAWLAEEWPCLEDPAKVERTSNLASTQRNHSNAD